MAYFKKRKYSKKRTYKSKGYKKRIRKTKKPMVKLIQSVINKNAEDKFAWRSVTNVFYNSGINSQTDVTSIMPSISVGAGDASRVGVQIHGKQLTIQGHMINDLTTNSYSDVRICVRMMVVSPKGYTGYTPAYNAAATWLAYLLKKGATTTGFTGLVSDLYAPINTDAITCHYDKLIYLNAPYVPFSTEGAYPVTRSTKFFKISLPVNRIFKYDSSVDSGLLPVNYAPFIILGYSHLDSSSADVTQTQVNLSWTAQFKYQDT